MPIPQLNKKVKGRQGWRANRKKYYVSGNKKRSRASTKVKRSSRLIGPGGDREQFLHGLKKKLIVAALIIVGLGIVSAGVAVTWISRDLPKNPDELLKIRDVAQTTKIYDRTGETVLYEIHGDQQRTLVKLDDIPDYVKWATIAIEDKDFYNHGAISFWGILRGVVWQKIRGRAAQGGSTLTQQFVKNAILTPERTIQRKIKEWILSYELETKYSKKEILQMYLNEIPYGSTAYGVEAASQRYFGKSVHDINLPEAAILAALPQAPSYYSPYGPNKDALVVRQHTIINLMYEQGYISEAKRDAAKQYRLTFERPQEDIIAPHFVMYVKEMLSAKYGEKAIEQGGLKIYTTLDLYKQKIAEETIADHAETNEKKYDATNAALVSIDPKTGQILAMVGSRDFFNEDIDGQVNVTTSPRQPGSSLKPLVYASAFLKGYTPDTVLYDVVTDFSDNPDEPYEPHNYDDKEHGPITARKALAGSLNIPAVKTIYLAGINNVLDLAQEFGYTTLNNRGRFGLSLVLGGGEVKLLEHVNAYGVFAREGVSHPISVVLKVEDKDGKVLEEYNPQEKKVLDSEVARKINDILSDNEARAYAFGERNWLTLGARPVAAKTGTTNDYRDAWTVGYTPSIVTGVWVGNSDNAEMKRGAAGGTVAAPIWHDYMQKVLGDTPVEIFNKPKPIKTGKPVLDGKIDMGKPVKIDKVSGLLATKFTPEEDIEKKIFADPHCILYYVKKDDPRGEAPENPENDPQFDLWESRVISWAEKKWASSTEEEATSTLLRKPPPTEYDNVHKEENLPKVEIIAPDNNGTLLEPLLVVRIAATAPRGINRAEYYLGDNLLFVNKSYPFNLEKNIAFLPNGFHNLKIKVCDDINNCTTKEIEFNLVLEETGQSREIELTLAGPKSGLAVSNIDFPLNIEVQLKNSKAIARLDLYYKGEGGEPVLLTTIQPIENEQLSVKWRDIPASGTYRVYGVAAGWNKQQKKSNEIILIVNNINPPPTEEEGE